MNVYGITPTGMRPEGLALLGEYISAQNYRGPLTWVIVDDCTPQTRVPQVRKGIEVVAVRPPWRWDLGMNTQVASMSEGLRNVPDDAVLFVFEDDDLYLPNYMDTMLKHAERHELVGEKDSRYYNVRAGKWRVLRGTYHASLCSTVCRGAALRLLKELCASGIERMLDFKLWKAFDGSKVLLSDHNVVGIKGMPGRPGVGVGHKTSFGSLDIDDVLTRWAGAYADNYRAFRRPA